MEDEAEPSDDEDDDEEDGEGSEYEPTPVKGRPDLSVPKNSTAIRPQTESGSSVLRVWLQVRREPSAHDQQAKQNRSTCRAAQWPPRPLSE